MNKINGTTNGTTHQPRRDGSPAPKAGDQPVSGPPHGDKDRHEHKKPSFLKIGLIVLAAAGVFLLVLIPRLRQKKEVREATDRMAVPNVTVVHPKPGPSETTLNLPGNVKAFLEAPLYARTDGYVKKWYFDIGAPVKEGQVLAEIETPEVDQQLAQSRAARDQASANLMLAKTSADRWNDLLRQHAVAQQESDQRNSDYAARQADYASADANVKRLESLQSFQKVTAPFDGIVTSRRIDIGSLINAGSSAAGQELFRVAQIGTLRVYVNVPEAFSSSVPVGTPATIDFASAPGVEGKGNVVSTAGAIDPQARTLLVEIQVPNNDGKFLPGGYAQIHFQVRLDHPALVVPANTLLFHSAGSQIGVVGPDHVVTLKKVQIGRDFGTTVEIVDGLQADDFIIVNPSDSLTSGIKVESKEKTDAQPGQTPGQTQGPTPGGQGQSQDPNGQKK